MLYAYNLRKNSTVCCDPRFKKDVPVRVQEWFLMYIKLQIIFLLWKNSKDIPFLFTAS